MSDISESPSTRQDFSLGPSTGCVYGKTDFSSLASCKTSTKGQSYEHEASSVAKRIICRGRSHYRKLKSRLHLSNDAAESRAVLDA